MIRFNPASWLASGAAIVVGLLVLWGQNCGAEDAKHEDPAHSVADKDKPAPHADDHGAGAHHDDTDLSHGNATVLLVNPADVRFDTAIYSFIIFILLLIILGKFAWGPISEGLEKRERGIEDKIAEAHLSAQKAAEQLQQYEAKLAAAADEAREIAVQARKDAEAAKEQILAEAKSAAQRERERAVEDITNAKNNALREIAEKSVNTAVALASNIVRREIKPAEHSQLIKDAMENFPSAN